MSLHAPSRPWRRALRSGLLTGLGCLTCGGSRAADAPPSAASAKTAAPVAADSAPSTAAISAGAEHVADAEQAHHAMDPSLPLEYRRYLLYLYARLNVPRVAEALGRRILVENPGDKQTLLVLASMHVERKEADRTIQCAEALLRFYPGDSEALYFLGAGYTLAGHHQRAEEVFRTLKERNFTGQLYPYAIDLANAAVKSGHWRQALNAYLEVLRKHPMSDTARLEVRTVLEEIYREHLPVLTLSSTNTLLKSGRQYNINAEYRQQVTDATKVWTAFQRYDLKMSGGNGFIERWTSDHDGQVGLATVWNPRWTTQLWGGSGADYGMGGAGATYSWGGERTVSLDLRGGHRANDSLTLESLHGRENRLGAELDYKFDKPWYAHGSVFGRELAASNRHAGWGGGGEWSLERLWRKSRPEWRAGYRGSYSRFAWANTPDALFAGAFSSPPGPGRRTLLQENTIRPELHREGVYTVWRGDWSGAFHYYFTTGVDYAFDRSAWEYSAGAGCSYFPRKRLELNPRIDYTTGANTSDVDTERWQLAFALRYWF